MDKCEVVIISHGRADNVITKKNVANCKLVVCKKTMIFTKNSIKI